MMVHVVIKANARTRRSIYPMYHDNDFWSLLVSKKGPVIQALSYSAEFCWAHAFQIALKAPKKKHALLRTLRVHRLTVLFLDRQVSGTQNWIHVAKLKATLAYEGIVEGCMLWMLALNRSTRSWKDRFDSNSVTVFYTSSTIISCNDVMQSSW